MKKEHNQQKAGKICKFQSTRKFNDNNLEISQFKGNSSITASQEVKMDCINGFMQILLELNPDFFWRIKIDLKEYLNLLRLMEHGNTAPKIGKKVIG